MTGLNKQPGTFFILPVASPNLQVYDIIRIYKNMPALYGCHSCKTSFTARSNPMKTFRELYDQAVALALDNRLDQLPQNGDFDPKQLDCLLNPQKHPLVIHTGNCTCTGDRQQECVRRCPFHAIRPAPDGGIAIDPDLCLGCSDCIDGCAEEKLKASTDILPALKAVRSAKSLAYALIAPAFLGQFSKDVTPGKLRTSLKAVGFDGMLEVALFADILTLKEAL
jgi:ferredoxin